MRVLNALRLGALNGARSFELELRHVGRRLDTGGLEPFDSLHELREMLWAVYRLEEAHHLHVAHGFEVRLNGRVMGGGPLHTGDVIESGPDWFRFDDLGWPGVRHEAHDALTLERPDDDGVALVYRDWALEHGSAIAEALRRPVPREEQARQLPFLAALVDRGLVEAQFAGPFVRRVVTRQPTLDLEAFTEGLVRSLGDASRLEAIRVVGLSLDDELQLALMVARALPRLSRLEAGLRGHWALDDFRHETEVSARQPEPRRAMRPTRLVVASWDGWTPVEPLTREGAALLQPSQGLRFSDEGVALVVGDSAHVSLRFVADWVLQVAPSVPASMRPRWQGQHVEASLALTLGDEFELVPGLVCRLQG